MKGKMGREKRGKNVLMQKFQKRRKNDRKVVTKFNKHLLKPRMKRGNDKIHMYRNTHISIVQQIEN